MAHVFISYASADQKFVEREVVGLLKALRLETWFAPHNIRSAELWTRSILTGLENSDWFILIVSAKAASSDWVKKELQWAFDNRPDKIIPVVIDSTKVSSVDKRLSRIQYLNFSTNRSLATQELVQRLVDAQYRGFQRDLSGRWLCAVQPVYYSRIHLSKSVKAKSTWHVQEVEFRKSSDGFEVDTVAAKGKLQWRWSATLVSATFLAGPWKSKRKSSDSHGYMVVQIARNGTYLFGHDYAVVLEEGKAHYGALLFGRDEKTLERALSAMKSARRNLLPLAARRDFSDRP